MAWWDEITTFEQISGSHDNNNDSAGNTKIKGTFLCILLQNFSSRIGLDDVH